MDRARVPDVRIGVSLCRADRHEVDALVDEAVELARFWRPRAVERVDDGGKRRISTRECRTNCAAVIMDDVCAVDLRVRAEHVTCLDEGVADHPVRRCRPQRRTQCTRGTRVTICEDGHAVATPFELLGKQRNDELDAAIRRWWDRVPGRRDQGDVHGSTTCPSRSRGDRGLGFSDATMERVHEAGDPHRGEHSAALAGRSEGVTRPPQPLAGCG